MCGLSLAWVTSENSTMLLESDILRLFFTGPYLVSSPLCSGVWCWLPLCGSTPTSLFTSLLSSLNCPPWSPAATAFCCLPLCSPATNSLSPVQLPTASLLGRVVNSRSRPLTTSGYGEIFLSKNPLSGFAPKQTRLLWRPTPIVLQSRDAIWSKRCLLSTLINTQPLYRRAQYNMMKEWMTTTLFFIRL